MIDPLKLKEFIERQGWAAYGIVSIEEVKEALRRHEGIFESWVEKEFHATMRYLEAMKHDRYHPENKLQDVRSVIVLQAWYSSDRTPKQSESHTKKIGNQSGLIARYARGRDYHKVLRKKLKELSVWLESEYKAISTYASVDSGPTVDRVLANIAGLGFFGKNANVIDPSRGSYFFIASLMVNIKLPETEKRRMPNCGDCQRCMIACPTKAIAAPGVIDARRCISYLTIENKDGIPRELRSAIGNRLFGCDICQEVCPFNEERGHHQEIAIDDLKTGRGVGEALTLTVLLSIEDDETFQKHFAGTPLMRAKRRGLLRNACVVAGNSGDSSLIPALQKLLQRENDDMLKEHAAWAIDRLQSSQQKP